MKHKLVLLLGVFLLISCVFAVDIFAASCGDGSCSGDENCFTCPGDCGVCECVDSDGGKNLFVKGTASSLVETRTDECSSTPGYILEIYCETPDAYRPIGYGAYCQHGCSDGACLGDPDEFPESWCEDSDGGKNLFVKGTATSSGQAPRTDSCSSNGYISEIYCETSDSYYPVGYGAYCQHGCSDGACLGDPDEFPESWCEDSDGGKNLFVKGTATSSGSAPSTDECSSTPGYIKEVWCINSTDYRPTGYNAYCQHGCLDGACLGDPDEFPESWCEDSDGGKNLFVKGTATSSGSAPSTDECSSSTRLLERWCRTSDSYRPEGYYADCESGCVDGACLGCGDGSCGFGEDCVNCAEDCGECPDEGIIKGELTLITPKDSYGINEVVMLTDPSEEEITGDNTIFGTGIQNIGWPKYMGTGVEAGIGPASAKYLDFDDDGDIEIIAGSRDGNIYAWHHDGTDVQGWPFKTNSYVVSTPVIGDINGDGSLEVVAVSNDGYMYALSKNGNLLSGWPILVETSYSHSGGAHTIGSPVLAYVDGDSYLDVVYNSLKDDKTYVFNYQGQAISGWPKDYLDNERIYNTPAVADLDGDGNIEIIAGIHYRMPSDVSTEHNKIYVWHNDGTHMQGWPVSVDDGYSSHLTSPVVGDVNGDGSLDILTTDWSYVYAFDKNGNELSGWPFNMYDGMKQSLALANFDYDDNLEVVATSDKYLYLIDDNGNLMNGFPVILSDIVSEVSVADIDNDGENEIVCGRGYPSNSVFAFNKDGSQVNGFPLETNSQVVGAPIILDIDNDGTVEIGGYDYGTDGDLYFYMWDLTTQYNPSMVEWPMYRHDPWNTGVYGSGSITPKIKSQIKNTGTADIIGYLLMSSQKYDGTTWKNTQIVINETTDRTIQAGQYLALDTIWEAAGAYTTTTAGNYKAYAALRDINGQVIQTQNGPLEGSYEFTVEGTTSCGDGSCSGDETCSSCSEDCGECAPECGDGECNGDETCETCVADCGKCSVEESKCGNLLCGYGEDYVTCPEDCGKIVRPECSKYDTYCKLGITSVRKELSSLNVVKADNMLDSGQQGTIFPIKMKVTDFVDVVDVRAVFRHSNMSIATFKILYDDGAHGDNGDGDGIYGNLFDSANYPVGNYRVDVLARNRLNHYKAVYKAFEFEVT